MSKHRFISLFSGCGGLDLGFIKAGFTPIAAYDIWSLAVDNYKKNIGDHVHICDLSQGRIPKNIKCEVVVAGSPCQGFSTVGKRRLDDPRNDLLHSAVSIAITAEPQAMVFENVPGVLQGGHKIHWDKACAQLQSAGYKTSTIVVDARETGIPQTRKRVFLIAHTNDNDYEPILKIRSTPSLDQVLSDVEGVSNHEPMMMEPDSVDFKIASRISQGQKLCNVRAGKASVHTWEIPEAFGEVTDSEESLLKALMRIRRRRRVRDYGDADPVPLNVLEKELRRKVKREVSRLENKGYLRWIGENIDLKHTFNGKYRRPYPHGSSCTVDTRFGDPRNFLHPYENRGFSVREAARIQGFPDSYIFYGPLKDQYKLVGNAVPPTMGHAIGEIVKEILKEQ